ncbi:MAG: GTPase HflX [Oscillospiraceae bacterium]|jgi:GTP-binding protein HflX|nr:GTPase HflX [Oscillospiraceae bacterium]
MIETQLNAKEKAVLAGLCAESMEPGDRSGDETLDELEALLETAGGVSVGRVLQNRQSPDPRSFIGHGKALEMKALIEAEGAELAVFDNDLTPSQLRALSDSLGVRVIDRSALILDIFAERAATRVGRIQVELAQYKYILPRLSGMWGHLVRQTGTSAPIGTRGPGETQLETDRRHIRNRIARLEREISEVMRDRATERRRREKNEIPVIALVGYTNAGKSTLFNQLTGSGIHAEDRLFDTLDTTTRRTRVSDSTEALIVDTVGFIRKLPHHLVDAFRATLDELRYADLVLHVIDASNSAWREQTRVTDELISQLGAGETPRIEVFNKCDLQGADILPHGDNIVSLSAKTGEGVDSLLALSERLLGASSRTVTLHIPYADSSVLDELYKKWRVNGINYTDSVAEATVTLDARSIGRYNRFLAE